MPQSTHSLFDSLQSFETGGREVHYYSLPTLEEGGIGPISKLPISIRVLIESLLRNYDDHQVTERDITDLANWNAATPKAVELPFKPARVVAQDFTGVPLVVDIAAMRAAVQELGGDPMMIEPLVPVDLVIDHSVQVDSYGSANSLQINTKREFERNKERYEFLKWGQQAFEKFKIVPPSVGIVHQVNLEYLAQCVMADEADEKTIAYFDTLVGTDSHTTMINGLGIVGWGVGGIEAEAAMLGQPVYILTPEVLGVHLTGSVKEGVTATDLVLTVTQRLREKQVVGKFVEFFGEGVEALSLPDRATISNMCPEYGATIGFFPPDDEAMRYLRLSGRNEKHVQLVEAYLKNQSLFGVPGEGEVEYSDVLDIDLDAIEPSIAGPKRPQDRIELSKVKEAFRELLTQPITDGGYGLGADEAATDGGKQAGRHGVTHGDSGYRRHHELHEHKQSVCHDRRRLARQERGGEGPLGSRLRQDQSRPRLAGCDGIPTEYGAPPLPRKIGVRRGGIRLHHLHRQQRPHWTRQFRRRLAIATWLPPAFSAGIEISRRGCIPMSKRTS